MDPIRRIFYEFMPFFVLIKKIYNKKNVFGRSLFDRVMLVFNSYLKIRNGLVFYKSEATHSPHPSYTRTKSDGQTHTFLTAGCYEEAGGVVKNLAAYVPI